jgi:Putative bacterial sensory transduction regulator
MTPRDVRDYLIEEGYRAKLDESDIDCSTIESADEGLTYLIRFYRPTPPDGDLDNFESVSFSTGREVGRDFAIAELNNYNAKHRFSKMYFEDGGVWLEMDNIIYPENLTPNLFEDFLGFWSVAISDFVKLTN